MQLESHVKSLQDHLVVAAEAGDEVTRDVAARLVATLDSAARLVLLEALSAAADEITREIAPGSVEVRLRAGEPEFAVMRPATDDSHIDEEEVAPLPDLSSEGGTARLNLRLPESLKDRIDHAANAEGISLNAWLIRAANTALGVPGRSRRRIGSGSEQFTGWVR